VGETKGREEDLKERQTKREEWEGQKERERGR
jgi:hypothetical protein